MTSLLSGIFFALCCKVMWSCTFEGTDFLIMSPIKKDSTVSTDIYIVVLGEPQTSINLTGPQLPNRLTATIDLSGFTRFELSQADISISIKEIPYPFTKKSYRLVSSSPVGVVVHADNADGYTAVPASTGSTYFTSSYIVDYPDSASYVAVAAYDDDTVVSAVIRSQEQVHEVQFVNQEYVDGDAVTPNLVAHEVMFMWGYSELTGTKITSNKPVSVFIGVNCLALPLASGKCQSVIEQMLPSACFDSNSVNFPVTSPTVFRAIAITKNTHVSVGTTMTSKDLSTEGEFIEWESSPPNGYVCTSSNPVMSVQYQRSSTTTQIFPTQTIMLSPKMYAKAHRVVAVSGFNTVISMITAKDNNNEYPVFANNQQVATYETKTLNENFVEISFPLQPGIHKLTWGDSRSSAVYVYGNSPSSSFSFHGVPFVPLQIDLTTSSSAALHTTSSLGSPASSSIQDPHLFRESSSTFSSSALISETSSLKQTDMPPLFSTNNPSSTNHIHLTTVISSSETAHLSIYSSKDCVSDCSSMSAPAGTQIATSASSDVIEPSCSGHCSYTSSPTMSSSDVAESSCSGHCSSSSTMGTSSVTNVHSFCTCLCQTSPSVGLSQVSWDIKASLTLQKESLGAYIRSKTSAPDNRPSAKGFGYFGLIVIVAPVCLMIMGDARSILMHFRGYYW